MSAWHAADTSAAFDSRLADDVDVLHTTYSALPQPQSLVSVAMHAIEVMRGLRAGVRMTVAHGLELREADGEGLGALADALFALRRGPTQSPSWPLRAA